MHALAGDLLALVQLLHGLRRPIELFAISRLIVLGWFGIGAPSLRRAA